MDAQYPFASRDDIWRVFDELKELHATQFEQAERIARLERRRDEDARLKSVWGPLSPFPSAIGGAIPTEPTFHPHADAFKGFDQGQNHGMVSSAMGLDSEEEPRRGASRANSVRFDESAIHGYYGQASRSSSELPLRTGSGMGSHPLTERSLSHRSDGRQSSSGFSHHSARTNSLGLETTSKMMSSSAGGSPLIPPPGLFLLGPVPCIIRCWLTTNFSNESLLYAAVCSGSYASSLGYPMVRKLGLDDLITQEEDSQYIKLPLYLPEASLHQSSSRSSSPLPQLPALTIRFLVRDVDPNDASIQIILGSDVLRSHNADVLFSQDKIIMVDDERNKISIPLVRPENDSAFKNLSTVSETPPVDRAANQGPPVDQPPTNGQPASPPRQTVSAPVSARVSIEEPEDTRKPHFATPLETTGDPSTQQTQTKPTAAMDSQPTSPAKPEGAGVWSSWRRDPKLDPNASATGTSSRGRTMKVLRPTKSSSRVTSTATALSSAGADNTDSPTSQPEPVRQSSQPASRGASDEARASKQWASNPIGGASAFGWLNSSQPSKRVVTNPK
ncbi:hypothetical protein ASPWEDRAFT_176156 [Aspergillus wentii DTO 134E9]|uniref:Ubiquitin carboxyl-terminal hydrolase 19 n=1 Tax=Aspergillus wentii DTO 134E9 TaxID=1073089 RepID=A0A1L9R850_ASPWE|nr:uncharacterized protein ASPWEDRAFT_176156 [Aspergillus wentii DTO 134E9]KAI9927674.1 hypothetical protein MW887_003295 [Aspergillus wentii]OJJ31053.1 hypothetical protein ASPWEDRAFT_176156 [Aspergillus wentii DTO 134E9]